MKKDTKLILIVLAGILAIVLLCVFAVQGTQNKAEKQIAKINEKLKFESLPRGKGLWKHRLFSFYIFQECEYYDT